MQRAGTAAHPRPAGLGANRPGPGRQPGPGPHTLWDYRQGAFQRGWGLRTDLDLAAAPVAARCTAVTVDRDERKPTSGEGKPSDHARSSSPWGQMPDAGRRAMISRSTDRATRARAATGPSAAPVPGLPVRQPSHAAPGVPRLRQLRHHLLEVAAPGLDVSGSLPDLGLVAAADPVRDLLLPTCSSWMPLIRGLGSQLS